MRELVGPQPVKKALAQVTGTALKVGDVVQRARCTVGVADALRETGTMEGVVVKVIKGGGSGARQRRTARNAVVVRWASGSECRHDADMIIKVMR